MQSASIAKRGRLTRLSGRSNRYVGKAEPGRGLIGSIKALIRLVGWMFFLALVVVLMAGVSLGLLAGYRWLTSHPYFSLKQVEVVGNSRLSDGEVLQRTGVFLGQNTLELSMGKIQQNLSDDPWIDGVTVRRVLPDRLHIEVDERKAFFWVQMGEKLYYADYSGEGIVPVAPEKFVSLPMLSIPQDDIENAPEFVAGFVDFMEQRKMPFALPEVSWVRISRKDGVEVYLEGRDLLLVSDLGDWRDNFLRIKQVWSDLEKRGELSSVRRITGHDGKVWLSKT